MIKKKQVILFLTLFLILALALAGGFTLLWRLFIFLVVIMLLSRFWTRLSLNRLDGSARMLPSLYRVGDEIRQEFTLANRSRIPTPLIEIRPQTDLPGDHSMVTINLPSRSSYRWYVSFPCQKRGQFRLGRFSAGITDPLGFFKVSRELGQWQEVIVYPATVDLPFFQALPSQEPGASPRRWLASEVGPNVSRVRQYTAGDSLRHIHWPSTAHAGRLMVREFDPDRSSYAFKYLWLVLDMHQDSQSGEGNESTGEYIVTIAASLAKKYLEAGKRVGLIASGDRPYLHLPELGEGQMHRLMQSLALMRAEGHVSLESLLKLEVDSLEPNTAAVIIMPAVGQDVIPILRRYVSRGVIVTAVLLDSRSFGGRESASDMAGTLASGGVYVYTVARGMRISGALDSRWFVSRGQLAASGVGNWQGPVR